MLAQKSLGLATHPSIRLTPPVHAARRRLQLSRSVCASASSASSPGGSGYGDRLKQALGGLAAGAAKSAAKVDADYGLSGKASSAAAEAASKAQAAAEHVNRRFQLRQRLANLVSDARRTLPRVGRQVGDFFNTPAGAVTFTLLLVLSVYTGVFWRLLRGFVVLTWCVPMLLVPILSAANAKASAQQREQYKRAYEAQQQARTGGLGGMKMEDLFKAFTQRQQQGQQQQQRGGEAKKQPPPGVIDVDHWTVDKN